MNTLKEYFWKKEEAVNQQKMWRILYQSRKVNWNNILNQIKMIRKIRQTTAMNKIPQ